MSFVVCVCFMCVVCNTFLVYECCLCNTCGVLMVFGESLVWVMCGIYVVFVLSMRCVWFVCGLFLCVFCMCGVCIDAAGILCMYCVLSLFYMYYVCGFCVVGLCYVYLVVYVYVMCKSGMYVGCARFIILCVLFVLYMYAMSCSMYICICEVCVIWVCFMCANVYCEVF